MKKLSLLFLSLTVGFLVFSLNLPAAFAGGKEGEVKIESSKCEDHEIDVSEELRLKKRKDTEYWVLFFLNKNLKSESKCYSSKDLESFVRLQKLITKESLELEPIDIYRLILSIRQNQQSWIDKAKQGPHTVKVLLSNYDGSECSEEKCDTKATIYVKQNGNLIVSAGDRVLGKGKCKKATTRLEFSHGPGLSLDVKIIAALTYADKNPSEACIGNYKFEVSIYRYFRDIQSWDEMRDVRGIASAELIEVDGEEILIQEKFTTDLNNSTLAMRKGMHPHILNEIIAGLSFIHSLGFVHGDLKETNILVNSKEERISIADFGLLYRPEVAMFNRSTAAYEAPEMVGENELKKSDQVELVQKRDIFSFGIIGLHMLPNYFNDSLHARCSYLFKGYSSWGDYGTCIVKEAPILHSEIVELANKNCVNQERQYCKEAIVADCIHPNPDLRPTVLELKKRTEGLLKNNAQVIQ